MSNQQIVLTRVPDGIPGPSELEVRDGRVPDLADGQVLVRSEYWSVDPYQRVLMNPRLSSNLQAMKPGQVVNGGGLGRVVASRSADYEEGEVVVHRAGWSEYVAADAASLLKLGDREATTAEGLSAAGLPGFAAWIGMVQKLRPEPGETIFVSSAAGAVGSLAGQLAKRAGAHVIGSAGSGKKTRWLREIGFDAAFDYREEAPADALARLAPSGLDGYFDNVGGDHLDAALASMKDFGRIAMCGAHSAYNDEPTPITNITNVFTRSLTLYGYRQMDHLAQFPEFRTFIRPLLESGEIAAAEHVLNGVEAAVSAFEVMYRQRPLGKLLIHVR